MNHAWDCFGAVFKKSECIIVNRIGGSEFLFHLQDAF